MNVNEHVSCITGALCFPTASHVLETEVFPEMALLICLYVLHLIHLIPKSFLVHFTAQVMPLSISCFSLAELLSGGDNLKLARLEN